MVTNSSNTKAINHLLSTSFNIAFNLTFRTSLLKIRKDHIFERACFVLSKDEFLSFTVIVPSYIQSSRHWLTHRKGIELACVFAETWLAQINWFAEKSFVRHSFACKDNEGTTNLFFTNLLQQVFVAFSKRVKLSICWFMLAKVKYNPTLTYQPLFGGKIKSFSALLLELEQHFCYCSTWEKLEKISFLCSSRCSANLRCFHHLLEVSRLVVTCILLALTICSEVSEVIVIFFERINITQFAEEKIVWRWFFVVQLFGIVEPLIGESFQFPLFCKLWGTSQD